ncbi:CHK domain-containing protein [Aphis craccivora]|uniref:CHK domain-containing protein n=1 Tax=Aphis craccivora TaxID=307492 RepID=A0A6G0ZR27_APHCR|nr:CHK domain-containing protein [Aphis craccivora]
MDSLIREELPEIVNSGAFGKNLKYVSFDINEDYVVQNQYKSTVLFGTVNTSDDSKFNVVIKLKLRDETQCLKHKIHFHFNNEIIMYENIIPFLFESHRSLNGIEDWPSLCRFFYGRNKCGKFFDRDLIILENVDYQGFRPSKERPLVDYDHVVSALRALAKFHGLSYTAKHKDLDKLQKVIMNLRETQFDEDGHWIFKKDAFRRFGKRGIDRLLERNGDLYRDNEHLRRFNKIIDNVDISLKRVFEPQEPFSVVCHGDFNVNNVLFRYDKTGLPIDVLLFDFGTPRYGSPALDISFLLYMNTTQDLREKHWDDLLNEYCLTLAKSVPSGVRVPNRIEMDSEIARCAFYGFANASFFLPHQLELNVIYDEDMTEEETIQWLLKLGGDIGTERVADMVQHIVDMKYTNV